MAKYKNTTFREGYNPTFSEFKKSHKKTIGIDNLADAYKALTGNKPTKSEITKLQKEINGNSGSTTSESEED